VLDQKPLTLGALAPRTDEHPRAAQDVAVHRKSEVTFGETCARIALRFPRAMIEHVDVPCAVIAFRNITIERGVRDRMIFHFHMPSSAANRRRSVRAHS
jgi:hypothetical protein